MTVTDITDYTGIPLISSDNRRQPHVERARNPNWHGTVITRNPLSEAQQRLTLTTNQIRLSEVGAISDPPQPRNVPQLLVDRCMKFAVAQALIDGVEVNPRRLSLRGLLPHRDFAWGSARYLECGRAEPIPTYWRTPVAGEFQNPTQPGFPDGIYDAFEWNRNSSNDRKVILFYGFMALEPLSYKKVPAGALLAYDYKESYVANVSFLRSRVKTIAIYETSHITRVDSVVFRTPVLYKKYDDGVIRFQLTENAPGKHVKIMPLGVVCEPLGNEMCG